MERIEFGQNVDSSVVDAAEMNVRLDMSSESLYLSKHATH